MEPAATIATAIIAALAAGATSGANDVAKKVIGDGYQALKALLKKKFGGDSDLAEAIDKLESKPDSEGRKQTLTEELTQSNAAADPEALDAAQALLEQIKTQPGGEQRINQIAKGIGIAQAGGGSTASVSISGLPGRKDG